MKDKITSSFQVNLEPLRSMNYRRLLISNTLWWQAMWMEMIVVGWLVLEITNSAWQVSLISFYRTAPLLIVGFFSGLISDRIGRIRTILLCQTITLTVASTIALFLWTSYLSLWHLSISSAILGIVWSLTWTARRSLLPDFVRKDQTVDAMILENFSQNISKIIGPIISGTLIGFFGAWACYLVLAVISTLSLFVLVKLAKTDLPKETETSKDSPWTQMVESVRYIRSNSPIFAALLITIVTNYLVFPYHVLLPVFARDILNQGPFGLGLLGASSGIGSFLGLLIINKIRPTFSNGWIFIGGSIFMSLFLVPFSFSSHFSLSVIALILSGAGQSSFSVMQSAIVLISANKDMRSRIMGTLVIAIGAGPFGNIQIGALSERIGAPSALAITSSLAILLICTISKILPDLRQKDSQN